jgi:subtilisin-like proprotein convertase family protein
MRVGAIAEGALLRTGNFLRRAALHGLLGVLLSASPWVVSEAAGGEKPAPKRAPAPAIELEVPDDPPGKYVARDNPLARSPQLNVPFGSYMSIQVNVDALGHNIVGDAANEPSIAVSPTNPLNMVIGWRQFDDVNSNFRQAGWAYTMDGGQTWTFPGVLQAGVFRSDPVLDVDSHGNFYYQSLKSNLLADVYKSTNGGVSWLAPVTEFGGDKNWLAVDRSGGASNGQIYGIWQRFGGACCGSSVFTRSVNGGASFQTPVPVVKWPTFGMLAVGPTGEVYATGVDGTTTQDFDHFVVAKSTNASNPATSPTFTGGRVALGGSMLVGGAPNPVGLLGQANVAVDGSSGPARGNVYVAASVAAADPVDVSFIRSTDGGTTWSAPVRVDDDPSPLNWQWFAAEAVSPSGRIDMIWNDSRGTGQPNLVQLYYAYSWDGGATWSANVAVSPVFDSLVGFPDQSKIGDYSGIVSNATGADVAYAATFNGEEDIYYVRVFPDCNANGVSDVTDIANGTSVDCDSNHLPDECQVAAVCGPSLIYESSAPSDSCPAGGAGGGNGAAEPGEDVVLPLVLRNDGTVNLTGVSATLTTSTPGVTVTRGVATFPDVPTHGVASSNAPHFSFTVGTAVPCGAGIDFTIAATAAQGSWTRTFTVPVGAQGTATATYDSTDVPKAIPDLSSATSSLTVPATGVVLDVDVGVSITHTFDGDLVLVLIGPTGKQILLANSVGVDGVNFTGTVFDDEAATSITSGAAPFTGRFQPQQPLSRLDGVPADGTWTLEVLDQGLGNIGTIDAWSVTPTYTSGFVCSACNVSLPAEEPVTLTWSPGSKSSLEWEPIAGATFYNVYRGAPADLPSLLTSVADSCRRTATNATVTGNVLTETPPDGSFYWYLVRAANGAGEGPAGDATAGPRSQESTGDCP